MGKDLGVQGYLFGGIMLSWIDESAGTLAAAVCRSPYVVTVKIEEVIFKKAVKVGYQIRIYGSVEEIGNSSIRLYVEARKYNVETQEEDVVCYTRITFVKIDKTGKPSPISEEVRALYTK